jgi:hypothetical protein
MTGFLDETAMEQSSLKLLDSLAVTTIKISACMSGKCPEDNARPWPSRGRCYEPSVVLFDEPWCSRRIADRAGRIYLAPAQAAGVWRSTTGERLAVADRIIVLRWAKGCDSCARRELGGRGLGDHWSGVRCRADVDKEDA